jgi:mono/diheme cytochrome c family protein
MAGEKRFQLSIFWSVIITIVLLYLFLKLGVPYLSMKIVSAENLLPIPGALMAIFLILILVGIFVYVTASDQRIEEFLDPITRFLRGEREGFLYRAARVVVLVLFPVLLGWAVYSRAAPQLGTPAGLRIQHPTIPGEFEKLENPFRKASPEKQAQYIVEGRVLYQKNCRPCHGTKADGNGPMAGGFRLKPIDFTDPGTIATVVESYAFWRVKEGGIGLPAESTPWDSAMPRWEKELSDEEIWKIIMAVYDIAGVEPRVTEKLE